MTKPFQHFIQGDSSELKSENIKGSVLDVMHVRNQVTFNDENLFCLRSHILIQSMRCRLPQIHVFKFERIKKISGKKEINKNKKTDADTMCGNILLPVTHK